MRLQTEIEEGIVTDEDIEEFAEMFKSGEYSTQEIMEWFGITIGKFKAWRKEALERRLIENAKMVRRRAYRWRTHESDVW